MTLLIYILLNVSNDIATNIHVTFNSINSTNAFFCRSLSTLTVILCSISS